MIPKPVLCLIRDIGVICAYYIRRRVEREQIRRRQFEEIVRSAQRLTSIEVTQHQMNLMKSSSL